MTASQLRHLDFGRFLRAGTLALLLGWTGTHLVYGQAPFTVEAVPEPVSESMIATSQRVYWKKNTIHLPIQIKDEHRPLIREVQLYVKEQAAAPWKLYTSVGAEQKVFTFSAPRDGEYAFTMVTVDRQGRSLPADVRNEAPALVVIIDTQPPVMELMNLGMAPEGQLVRFQVRDANLDITRLRLYFEGGDRQFRPMEPVPTRPNVFCVPVQAVFTGRIQAMAEDFAGNVIHHDCNLNQLPSPAPPVPTPPVTAQLQHKLEPEPTPPNRSPGLQPAMTPNVFPREAVGTAAVAEPEPRPPQRLPHATEAPSANPHQRTAYRPNGSDGPHFFAEGVGTGPSLNLSGGGTIPLPLPTSSVPQTSSVPLPTPSVPQTPPATGRKTLPKRQLVNQSKVYLDYQLENSGQGVARVEVWITRDKGGHWDKLCSTTQGKNPVEVQLPEDGLYGITLLVADSRGQTGPLPAFGEAPDWLIELDTSKPTAQITNLQTMNESGGPVVQISWLAQDNNLGENPVDLFYSATAQGPWLEIARGLKSEGQYRWTPLPGIGSQAFLRMIARDLAGNISISNTLEPILFGDDASRPRAVIKGIRTDPPSNSSGL